MAMVLLQSSVGYDPLGIAAIEGALLVALGVTLAVLLAAQWVGRITNVAGRVLGCCWRR
jgi:hypothetical protein